MAEQQPNRKPLVVVTGASTGIGNEIVRQFSKAGHPVLALALDIQEMNENLKDCLNVEIAQIDTSDFEAFQTAINKTVEKYGPVDCLVNNAGKMALKTFFGDQDPLEWKKMIDTNITGYLNGMKCVINDMKKQKQGTIINIGSIAGDEYFPSHAVYCSTKAAVNMVTDAIRQEVASYNVRVCLIAPGQVDTEILQETHDLKAKIGWKLMAKTQNLGILDPEDVADAVLYCYNKPQKTCIRKLIICPVNQTQ